MGAALQIGGQVAQQAGSMMQAYENKRLQIQNKNELHKMSLDYEREANDIAREHFKINESSPVGSTKGLTDKLTELRSTYLERATNDEVRNMFGQGSADYNFGAEQKSLDWETPQLIQNTAATTAELLDEKSVDLVRNPTRATYDKVMADSVPILDNLGAAGGDNLRKKAELAFKAQAAGSMFTSLINNDQIDAAKRELNSKYYDDALGPDGINAVKKQLKMAETRRAVKVASFEHLKFTDPYKYLEKSGVNVPMLDLQTFSPEGFRAREAIIDKYKGQVDLPYLTPLEVKVIEDRLPKMSSQEQVASIRTMLEQNDPITFNKYTNGIWDQSEGMRPWVVAAQLVGENSVQAQRQGENIIKGLKLMGKTASDGRPEINTPSIQEFRGAFDAYVGNALNNGEIHGAIQQAAAAAYVEQAYRTNTLVDSGGKGYLDPDKFEQAIDNIMGRPISLNGQMTTSFRGADGNYLSDDDFMGLMDNLTTDQILRSQGDIPRTLSGQEIKVEKARGRTSLQALRDGVYALEIEQDGEIVTPLNKQGRLFELDLKKIHFLNTQPKAPVISEDRAPGEGFALPEISGGLLPTEGK